jgi:hypothetical protein
MGLLDDAIREHLELKRRHGADPGEVERQEREALGSPPADEPDQEPQVAAPVAEPEPAAEPLAGDPPPTTVMEPADVDEIEPPAGEDEPPAPGREADSPGYDEDPWLEEDQDETQPRDAAAAAAAEDDVLEETPEFLQETPEHDRLWFEQKPPRDFDWDR